MSRYRNALTRELLAIASRTTHCAKTTAADRTHFIDIAKTTMKYGFFVTAASRSGDTVSGGKRPRAVARFLLTLIATNRRAAQKIFAQIGWFKGFERRNRSKTSESAVSDSLS